MPRHCPSCTDLDVRPSTLKPVEWPLLLALLRPFRCRTCHRRFLRPLWW